MFWHKVYMFRPPHKNPGFKIDKVDWRRLLYKKDRETIEKDRAKKSGLQIKSGGAGAGGGF